MKSVVIALIISIFGGVFGHYTLGEYCVEENYSIQFSTKRAEGTFRGLQGIVDFNESDLSNSKMNVSVDVSTIQTGNETKDDHARGEKWFNESKYPKIYFDSDNIVKSGENYIVVGNLKIKDVSKEMSITFSPEIQNAQNFLIGTAKINRKGFNIKGNSFAFLVGKEVSINLQVPAQFNQ